MSDDQDDPFEKLDESVGDRDGDPFHYLGDEGEDHSPDEDRFRSSDDEDWHRAPDDEDTVTPAAEPGESAEQPRDAGDRPADSDGSGMSFGVGGREPTGDGDPLSGTGDREGDPFGNVEKAFAEMDVEQIDPDSVWQELTSAQSRGSVGDAHERIYAEVSKHSYCEQCEYFSEPPDVRCDHEGTEIVEFLDMDTVRVVDCPVVTEREKLEDEN